MPLAPFEHEETPGVGNKVALGAGGGMALPALGYKPLLGDAPGHLFPHSLLCFPVLFPILTAALSVLSFSALLLSLRNEGVCPVSSPEPGFPCRAPRGLWPP